MAKKVIVVDGYIGPYQFSKQYIRNELSGNSNSLVTVQISSLGGSVDHAINIYDQFVEHGNITAELSAFVASSATVISLGAKTVRMNENSFYLIHKAMNWVDEWGTMNEDEIEVVIAKLEKQKQQLAKVTLQLAKMYTVKTGKSLKEITDLMKEETWLTADEAKHLGFVDEIYKAKENTNYLDTKMVAMISASGYPIPELKTRMHLNTNNMADNKDEKQLTFKSQDELKAFMKKEFGFEPKAEIEEKKPVVAKFDIKDENSLVAWFKETFNISPKAQKPETKETENSTAVENLKTQVSDKDTEIETLKGKVADLEKKPGAKPATPDNDTDDLGAGDQDKGAENFHEAFASNMALLKDENE
ncbi:MAG: Clp protease ClpP [Bacteroidetes bacterium]|nr:Clp protease ClpP [Bacteroidota bacterium]